MTLPRILQSASAAIAALGMWTLLVMPPMHANLRPEVDAIAEAYVRLVLAIGQHDADYVDAYYGPAAWREEARTKSPLAALGVEATSLIDRIQAVPLPKDKTDELPRLRQLYLQRQLEAASARIRILAGGKLSFDEESQALYDAVAPHHPEAYFQKILSRLDAQLPGDGPADGSLQRLSRPVRDPAGPTRRGVPSGDRPHVVCGRRSTWSSRRGRISRSST